jgi:hypothetical protein
MQRSQWKRYYSISIAVSTVNQFVSRGSQDDNCSRYTSIFSSGFGISRTFSQTTGIIQPGGFSSVQTSGIKINATTTNLPTRTFTVPTVSTTLAFSVTATSSVCFFLPCGHTCVIFLCQRDMLNFQERFQVYINYC